MKEDLSNVLKKQEMFRGLTPDQYSKLSKICKKKTFRGGESLFIEGSESLDIFLVLKGKVKVIKKSPKGVDRELAAVGDNTALGEMSLALGIPKSATGIAIEDTEVLLVDAIRLRALLERNDIPSFVVGFNLLRMLASRLNSMNEAILRLMDEEESMPSGRGQDELASLRQKLLKEWSF